MKHVKALLLILVLSLCALVFASCDAKTVTRVYVNDEMHAIAEYSDGTTEDLGYVGVEVEKEVIPPKYTVTFLDAFGAVLKTEKVYKGDAATAPDAPEITDKSFDKWDVDFTAVANDLTVRPIYIAAAEYTVTFLDENGATLKTETVIHGHAATAPTAPLRADTIFKEWDTAFDQVTDNLTVRAVYREKETYTVTFKDYTGVTLGTAQVKETGTAQAPVTPARRGHTFAGWSGSLSNVTASKTVTAKYNLTSGTNLIDYDYAVKADGTVEMTLSVKGNVSFAVLQASLAIPAGATDVTAEGLSGAIVNLQGDACRISYFTVTNTTKATNVLKLTFKPASGQSTLDFALTVEKMTDAAPAAVEYTVIGDTLKLK